MKPAGVALGIIVTILWFLGATLIAAPSNVVNMIIPSSLHINSNEIGFIGVGAFIVSSILIALYTSMSKDEPKASTEGISSPSETSQKM